MREEYMARIRERAREFAVQYKEKREAAVLAQRLPDRP
jgi:hypothetical protein